MKLAEIFDEYGRLIIVGVFILIAAFLVTSFFSKSQKTSENVKGVEDAIVNQTQVDGFTWDTGNGGGGSGN